MKTFFGLNLSTVRFLAGLTLVGGWLLRSSAQDATAAFSPLPAGILPGSPLAQVVKLAKAGVDEGLIQSYVTNSTSTFNLDPDKIIYLKDAGVPNDLVTEMMQRDTTLQSQMATASTPPPPTEPPPDNSAPTPPPIDPNAQPDTGTPPPPPDMANDGSQPGDDTAPPDEPVTLNNFYDTLAPYGNWVEIEGSGRCWQPGVGVYDSDWQPYGDHGHWVYTDSGWYWASDYAWGWGPFHYGRWFRHDRYGWCWTPDTVWGPSWVVWRYSDTYCGWAPLPPGAYFQTGLGYMYNGNLVGLNFDFGLGPDAFIFVAAQDFNDLHPFHHRIGHDQSAQIYQQTTAVNGLGRNRQGFVNYGINPARISQISHTSIPTVSLRTTAGGTGRAMPSETVYRASSPGFAPHPPSGYLRTPTGTYTVNPVANRNYYTPPVPFQRPYYPPAEPPVREERPQVAAPARNYVPAQSAPRSNATTEQSNQQRNNSH